MSTEFVKKFVELVRDGQIILECNDAQDLYDNVKRDYFRVTQDHRSFCKDDIITTDDTSSEQSGMNYLEYVDDGSLSSTTQKEDWKNLQVEECTVYEWVAFLVKKIGVKA